MMYRHFRRVLMQWTTPNRYFKEHERLPGTGSLRSSLCRNLATLAINHERVEIMGPILESTPHPGVMYDHIKRTGSNPELIRVIDESDFESWVPKGKKFSDFPYDIYH
jgi:hypothetical protein